MWFSSYPKRLYNPNAFVSTPPGLSTPLRKIDEAHGTKVHIFQIIKQNKPTDHNQNEKTYLEKINYIDINTLRASFVERNTRRTARLILF